MKRLRKLVEYIRRYSTKYASFLATSYLTFTNEPCQLWSYWAEFHDIFTQYTGIIRAVNVHIEEVISRSISECQKGKKVKKCISVCATSTAPLRELTCHMGSHSVTCHPAEVTFQPLPQPMKAGTRFSDPRGMQG